ncbi:MAG TPA: DUF433 domain-containing protein [Gammaproteobacteria bacterium]|nr:DUF433 domain-containing protein [Gammaproteobacteria bacterium]
MNWQKYIHSDPTVLTGKPVIKGIRLAVDFLLGLLAEGWTEKTILENYPQLSREAGRDVVSREVYDKRHVQNEE